MSDLKASNLEELEGQLLAEVSRENLWRHAETLARWEKVSETPGGRAAVDYLKQQLDELGLTTTLYEFESLLGWPEEADPEVRSPNTRALKPSPTPPHRPARRRGSRGMSSTLASESRLTSAGRPAR
jgi:hypothetical protein